TETLAEQHFATIQSLMPGEAVPVGLLTGSTPARRCRRLRGKVRRRGQSLMPGEAVPVGLLTGSTPARRAADLRGKLASGELSLVVGTHALVEEAVQFARLGVAVVDEQHRFGVRQRALLDGKAPGDQSPHLLHMTATPIPRTVALAGSGDL